MTIASLVVSLSANAAEFHRQFEKAARRMEMFGRQVARAGREISTAISLPIIAAGLAAFKLALDESHRHFGPLFLAFEQLKARLRDTFLAVGQQLTPVFLQLIAIAQRVVTWIASLVRAFGALPPGIQKAIILTLLFLAALGPTVLVVGKLITAIGAIPKVLALLASPLGLTILAIAALGAAGLAIITHWDQVKLRMVLVWTAIKEAVFDAVDGVLGVLQTLTGWIPKLGTAITELRGKFDAWADQSLAKSAARIQQLEQGLRNGTGAIHQHGVVLQATRKILDDYAEGMRQLAEKTATLGPRFNAFGEQARLLKQRLEETIAAGPQVQAQLNGIATSVEDLATMYWRAQDAAAAYEQGLALVADGLLSFAQAQNLANRVASGALSPARFRALVQEITGIAQTLQQAVGGAFEALGTRLGHILAGMSHGFHSFGAVMEALLGTMLTTLGQVLIAYGVAGIAIKSFIANPLAAIAAGVALIALGSALSAVAERTLNVGQGGAGGAGGAATSTAAPAEAPGSGKLVLELHGDGVISAIFQDPRNQDALAQTLKDLSGRNVDVVTVMG